MYGPVISSFGLEMLRNDFCILVDNITCPDRTCRKQAVLTTVGNNLVYVCSDNCHILATQTSECPYWGCRMCGGDGGWTTGKGGEMCECWLPEPVLSSMRSVITEPLFV